MRDSVAAATGLNHPNISLLNCNCYIDGTVIAILMAALSRMRYEERN